MVHQEPQWSVAISQDDQSWCILEAVPCLNLVSQSTYKSWWDRRSWLVYILCKVCPSCPFCHPLCLVQVLLIFSQKNSSWGLLLHVVWTDFSWRWIVDVFLILKMCFCLLQQVSNIGLKFRLNVSSKALKQQVFETTIFAI